MFKDQRKELCLESKMTRYEWHVEKAKQLNNKAAVILGAVERLGNRLHNRMYDVWAEHVNTLHTNAAYHMDCCSQMTVEQAEEDLLLSL